MSSTRLKLPFIAPSQAQKHVTVNEAFQRLDILVQISLQSLDENTPPQTPNEGDCYGIGDMPIGIWSHQAGQIAAFQDGAWVFIVPLTGWRAWDISTNTLIVFDGTDWIPAAASSDTSPSTPSTPAQLGINTQADSTNRLSVKSDSVLLSHDDQTPGTGDVTLKLNRAGPNQSANLMFQNAYTTWLEMGLVQDQNFQIKILDKNAQFIQALKIDQNYGTVSLTQGLCEPRRSENATISNAGGTDWWGPADPMTLNADTPSVFPLGMNRIYFTAVFIPCELDLLGGFICQHIASTTSGAIIRVGLYEIGQASGNDWNLGPKVIDLGTQSADSAGNKFFDLASPQRIAPGWYVFAFGINGDGANTRACKWLTPGLTRLNPMGSGTGAYIANSGAGVYFWKGNQASVLVNGFPEVFPANPLFTVTSIKGWIPAVFIPKWRAIS